MVAAAGRQCVWLHYSSDEPERQLLSTDRRKHTLSLSHTLQELLTPSEYMPRVRNDFSFYCQQWQILYFSWNCLTTAAAPFCCRFSVLNIQERFKRTVFLLFTGSTLCDRTFDFSTFSLALFMSHKPFIDTVCRENAATSGNSKSFKSGRSLFCCRVDMELRCKAGQTNPTSTTMLEYSQCMSDGEITTADICALCKRLCKITRCNKGNCRGERIVAEAHRGLI